MLRFRIVPTSSNFPPAEVIASDAAAVLHIIERMNCKEAHVDRDGAYAFSVRLDNNGVWTIYQRHEPMRQDIQQAG